jgi:hypothetical protein
MLFNVSDDAYPTEIDYDTREGEIARRNVLFGLWVGRRLGLTGRELEDYAWSVHVADHRDPGHDDVIAKVGADLAARNLSIGDRQLRFQLREMALRASLDLAHLNRAAMDTTRVRAKLSTKKLKRKDVRRIDAGAEL